MLCSKRLNHTHSSIIQKNLKAPHYSSTLRPVFAIAFSDKLSSNTTPHIDERSRWATLDLAPPPFLFPFPLPGHGRGMRPSLSHEGSITYEEALHRVCKKRFFVSMRPHDICETHTLKEGI
jgi:hypothetical protein